MLRFLFASFLLTALSGCMNSAKPPAVLRPEITAAPKGKTFTAWGEFVLDAGDVVNLIVEELPQMSGIHKISPSGSISLPLVGMVRAKGLTEAQVRESIHLKVRPHVKMPRVSLNVVQLNSYVVYLEGKITKPGSFKLESPTTIQQAIAMAGGLKEGVTRISIVRDAADGTRKRFESSVEGMKDGRLDNFILERGDLIVLD